MPESCKGEVTTPAMPRIRHLIYERPLAGKTRKPLTLLWRLNGAKTDESEAGLPLIDDAREMLLRLKAKQEEYRKVFGKEYIENDYIFKNPDGSLYRPDSLTRTFQRVLKRKGYEHIRLHDLRHATATILYAKGWKVLEMQRWMRHSDIKTTLAIYTHLTNEQVVESSKSLNGLFSANAN